jgi:2,3-bisphosphoglycerate-independent phosphoglycerate mutase
MLLTADHGNAEWMYNEETHEPQTAHTTNVVPFILVDKNSNINLKNTGALCDIAPTVLDLMGIEQPAQMTGVSLIESN